MQLPAKETWTAQLHILECAIRIGFPVVVRTDGRTEVTSYPNQISRIDALLNSLTHGAPGGARSSFKN